MTSWQAVVAKQAAIDAAAAENKKGGNEQPMFELKTQSPPAAGGLTTPSETNGNHKEESPV